MAPDVVLERRDIEIAEQDHAARAVTAQRSGRPHFIEKSEFVRELQIDRRIGDVAACWDIEIMQSDGISKSRAFAEHGRDMPTVALAAKRLDIEAFERQTRKYDDAVITLLPIQRHVLIAEPLEPLDRKPVVGALGFLQTENVGPNCLHESRHAVDAQPHRIDVPRCDCQPHQDFRRNGRIASANWRSRATRSSTKRLRADLRNRRYWM